MPPRSALTPHPPKLHGMGDVNELLARRVAEAQARTAAVLGEVTVVPPSRYATVDTTTGEIVEHREESASAPTGPRDGLLVDGVGEERCTSLPTGVFLPLAPASPAPLVDGVGGEATPSSSGSACPASPPTPLVWCKPVKGLEAIVTACGRFSVSRARVMGVPRYQAWLRRPTPSQIGCTQDNADACKRIIEGYVRTEISRETI